MNQIHCGKNNKWPTWKGVRSIWKRFCIFFIFI